MTKQTIIFEYATHPDDTSDNQAINDAVAEGFMSIVGQAAAEFAVFIDLGFIPLTMWRKITIKSALAKRKARSPFKLFYCRFEYNNELFAVGKVRAYADDNGHHQSINMDDYRNFGAADRMNFDKLKGLTASYLLPEPIGELNNRSVSIEY